MKLYRGGLGTFLRTVRAFTPFGTSDAAGLQAAVTAMASVGEVAHSGGACAIDASVTIPSKSILRCQPASALTSTLSAGLYALTITSPSSGRTGTLAATPTAPIIGQHSISVTGFLPVVGTPIVILHGTSCQMLVPTAVTGSGPNYMVTTDEPLAFPFVSGDTVSEYSSLTSDVQIDGRGATITGTGAQSIMLMRSRRIRLSRFRFLPTGGAPTIGAFGVDLASTDCHFAECVADFTGIAAAGQNAFYFQSAARSTIKRCNAIAGVVGFALIDCSQSGIESSWARDVLASGNGVGFSITSLYTGVASFGCFDTWVSGGGAINCDIGMSITGAVSTSISNWSAESCSTYGIRIAQGSHSEPTDLVHCTNVSARNCPKGVFVNTGCTDVVFYGLDVSGSASIGVQSYSDITIYGLSAKAVTGAVISAQSGTTFRVIGGNVETTTAAAQAMVSVATVCDLTDVNVAQTGQAGAIAYYCAAGVMNLTRCRMNGSTATNSYGARINSGATLNIGPGCDLSVADFPLNIISGGTVTMVQTGGVAAFTGTAGTSTMSFVQHYCTSIEIGTTSPIATGSRTINALASFIGQEFTVKNSNTAASVTTVFGLIIPPASTWRIRCNSAGTWEHVTLI